MVTRGARGMGVLASGSGGAQVLSIGETVEEVNDSGFLSTVPTLRTQLLADDSMLQARPALTLTVSLPPCTARQAALRHVVLHAALGPGPHGLRPAAFKASGRLRCQHCEPSCAWRVRAGRTADEPRRAGAPVGPAAYPRGPAHQRVARARAALDLPVRDQWAAGARPHARAAGAPAPHRKPARARGAWAACASGTRRMAVVGVNCGRFRVG